MKKTTFFLVGLGFMFQGLFAQVTNPGVTTTTQPAPENPQLIRDTLKTIDVYDRIHIAEKKPIP